MAVIAVLIIAHILLIGGCYLFVSGIGVLLKGSVKPKEILTKPLFWGLFAILGGLCMIFSPWVLPALQQAMS